MLNIVKKCHENGDLNNLGFDVVTKEGSKCRFKPTKKGLHVHRPSTKEGGNMFGEIGDIEESIGGNCYATLGIDKMIPGATKIIRFVD